MSVLVQTPTGRRDRWLGQFGWTGLALSAAFLTLYVVTLAPDILPADNGEFQWVAATGGLAHPPGFPLHTLLGMAISRLPLGVVAWRINLLSAILAAGTLGVICITVLELTGRKVAGIGAAVALGSSTTFWAQATVSNVRTMAAFFTALVVYALVRHETAVTDRAAGQTSRGKNTLLLAASALTLGLTHHGSLLAIALCGVLFLVLIDPLLLRQPSRWWPPVGVALLCLLPLAYIPLTAPDRAGTWSSFLHYVLAMGFSGDLFYYVAPAALATRLQVMLNVLTFQFHPLLLAGGVAGALVLLRRRGRLAVLLVGGLAAHTLLTATYRAPQTVEYMLPAYVLFAVLLGCGIGGIRTPHQPARADHPVRENAARLEGGLHLLTAGLMLLAGLAQGLNHWPSYRALATSHDAREYARPILEQAPQGAIVLADWHWYTPLGYLQEVEGFRPDLTIEYVAPTAEPYEETWARRVGEELPLRPVVVTHYQEQAYAALPAILEPMGGAYHVRAAPRSELPDGWDRADLTLGDQLVIGGYRIAEPTIAPDRPLVVTIGWSLLCDDPAPITLFVHLVGLDGGLYAQQDVPLDTRHLTSGDVALTRFRLEARPGALPGRYSVQVGAYTGDTALLSPLQEVQTELESTEMVPSRTALYTSRPRRKATDGGLALVGVDWDLTRPEQPRLYLHWKALLSTAPFRFQLLGVGTTFETVELPGISRGGHQTTVHTLAGLPEALSLMSLMSPAPGHWSVRVPPPRTGEQYVPLGDGIIFLGSRQSCLSQFPESQVFRPALYFAASRPIWRDYVVSSSLIGLNADQTWAWRDQDDGIPALGAIPTLKWISGSRVIDRRVLQVPEQATSGRVIGALALYDAFTGARVPVLDERLAVSAPWVPLGDWTLRK